MASKSKLRNSLADMLVAIGMDEDTGLKMSQNQENENETSTHHHEASIYNSVYDAQVLAAITDSSAMFPQSFTKIDPMYPSSEMSLVKPVVQSPMETVGHPLRRHSTRRFSAFPVEGGIRRRSSSRRMTLKTIAAQPLAISTEIVNSLTTFCFPDGARVYNSRPEEHAHYLVLTDIMGNNTYATCLTIYLRYSAEQLEDQENDNDYTLSPIINDEKRKDDAEMTDIIFCYAPMCLVLISRKPYFLVMKDCLSSIVAKLYRNTGKSSQLKDLAIRLTMTPTPPAGSLHLTLDLFGCHVHLPPPTFPGKDVVDLPLTILFNCFSLDSIVKVMSAILSSQRIVFLADDYALLTLISQSFLSLLLPFRWRVTYAPVLPRCLLDLVEAPGTFIMGCHSRHQSLVEEVDGIVLVNIDTGKVKVTAKDVVIPKMPSHPVRKFKEACRSAKRQYDVGAHVGMSAVTSQEAVQRTTDRRRRFNTDIDVAALELMVDLFGVIMPYLKVKMKIYFNREAFYQSLTEEYKPFYEMVFATDMFSVFLRDRFQQKRDYWNHLYEKSRPATRSASVEVVDGNGPVGTFPNKRRSRASSSILLVNETEATTFPLPEYVVRSSTRSFSTTLTLTLPGQPGQPRSLDGNHFYERCVQKLSRALQETKSPSLRASYLCLRGLIRVALGHNIEGLEDLYNLASTDNRLFPEDTVKEIMSAMPSLDLQRLKTTNFYKTSAHLSSLNVLRPVDECEDIITDFNVIPDDDVGYQDFCQRVQLAELASDHETLVRLYEALTITKGPAGLFEATIDPATFLQFYECWNDNDEQCQSMTQLLGTGRLEEEEVVLKVSSVIKTDFGTGRIVLTSKQLFVDINNSIKKLIRLRSIQRVVRFKQSSLFSTIDALKIFHKSTDRFPVVLCLKQDCELWYALITEMWSGVLAAERSRDPEVTSQAQTNVLLADAVFNSGQSRESSHHGAQLSEAVQKLCYFTHQQHQHDNSRTRDVLLQTINTSSKEERKTPVEALLYTPPYVGGDIERGQLLWCGLGNGKIKVYDVGTWKLVSDTISAKDRVVSLLEVGNHQVWAGSFDSIIYIIDINTRTCHQTLLDHGDIVADLAAGHDGKEVYSASLNGTVIVWNAEDLTKTHQIHVFGITLRSLRVKNNVLWCGGREELLEIPQSQYLGRSEVTIDARTNLLRRLTYSEKSGDRDKVMEFSRFIVRFNEIWTISSRCNWAVIWDRTTLTKLDKIVVENCRGLTEMGATDTKIWLGDKDGRIHIVDGERRLVVKTLEGAHSDSIRSMCVSPNGMVMVGGGGDDGKVTVWSSMAEECTDEF